VLGTMIDRHSNPFEPTLTKQTRQRLLVIPT
jgi:hypothetical protein